MKKLITLLLALILVIAIPCSSLAAERTFKLGSASAVGANTSVVGMYFCDLCNEAFGGKYDWQFYPAEQLGNDVQAMENMQVGLQDGACFSFDNFAQYAADLNIMSMAFAFENREHMYAFLESELAQTAFDKLDAAGFKVLNYRLEKNPRAIWTVDKPIATPDDLAGVKMRIPNISIFEKNFSTLGAVPTITSWAEYPFALLQGVVEGGEGSYENLVEAGLYESIRYVTLVEYAYPLECIVLAKSTWESFTEEEQAIIQECADKAADYFCNEVNTKWEADKKFLEEDGVTFVEFDKQAFIDKMAPLASQLEEEGYWDTPGLYEKVQALKDQL